MQWVLDPRNERFRRPGAAFVRRQKRRRAAVFCFVIVLCRSVGWSAGLRLFVRLHGDRDSSRFLGMSQANSASPGDDTDGAIGIDEQRIGDERDFFTLTGGALCNGSRSEVGQAGDEPWMVGVQVFEDDAFVASDFGDLLIGWSGLEKGKVEALGEGTIGPPRLRERAGESSKALRATCPRWGDRAEADGRERVGSFGHEESRGLQVGQRDHPVGVGGSIEANTDGIVRIWAAGGAFPGQARLGEALTFEQLAVVDAKASVAENFEGLVEVSDDESDHQGANGLLVWRVGVPDEHDVGARFVGGVVAG